MQMSLHTAAFLAPCTLAVAAASADVLVGPVVNPANGNTYYLLDQSTWTDAEAEAQTLGGHLATVNDSAEHQWIFSTFGDLASTDGRNLWIGLNDADSEGTFVWSSGDAASYRNWRPGEPNNNTGSGDGEDYALIWSKKIDATGRWNDGPNGDGTITPVTGQFAGTPFGVVEVVPEPTTAGLLAVASLGLLARRRRA